MQIKNSGTHPIVVIVLSILIFDDFNLGTYIFEQEFNKVNLKSLKVIEIYFLYIIFWGCFPRVNLMLLIRYQVIKSIFQILRWN